MKIHPRDFQADAKTKLSKLPTSIDPFYQSKEHYEEVLASHIHDLSTLQDLLYAHSRYALLIVFQAMDAAGKDGAIKHVMSGVNPQGCQVFSFKQPTPEDLAHDFLWRTTRCLPERGKIGIFNRSYYEEVLVVRVHPEILQHQPLPSECVREKKVWEGRFHSINHLESHLYRNGTRVVKIFLHVSKKEQRKRFLARIDDPAKNWKFSQADLTERKLWDEYQSAYEDCLRETSTEHAPWYVVPADDKKNAHLIVSRIVVDTLKSLPMSYPTVSPERLREFAAIRRQLAK